MRQGRILKRGKEDSQLLSGGITFNIEALVVLYALIRDESDHHHHVNVSTVIARNHAIDKF